MEQEQWEEITNQCTLIMDGSYIRVKHEGGILAFLQDHRIELDGMGVRVWKRR